jgi:hypothetical protein
MLALGVSSILKGAAAQQPARRAGSGAGAGPIVWGAAAAIVVGYAFTRLPRHLEWLELAIGIPPSSPPSACDLEARLPHEDRVLFRLKGGESLLFARRQGPAPPGR